MKRNPNNYGTVTKLAGERSRPYAALMPIYNDGGKPKRKAIGYFRTEAEARNALSQWNLTHCDKMDYTLAQLYDDFMAHNADRLSTATKQLYATMWKKLYPIQHRLVRDLKSWDFQRIIDYEADKGMAVASLRQIYVLAKLLEDLACRYEIIQRNYAADVILPKEKDKEEKEALTDEQIADIFSQAQNGNEAAMITSIMIGTGFRISELFALTVEDYDADERTLTGGIKTEYGKGRVIPVHSQIQPFLEHFLNRATSNLFTRIKASGKLVSIDSFYFRKNMFAALDLKNSSGGTLTPHATRHTFATLCHRFNLDDVCMCRLMGHSPKGITQKTYVHVGTDVLRQEIEKIDLSTICRQFTDS